MRRLEEKAVGMGRVLRDEAVSGAVVVVMVLALVLFGRSYGLGTIALTAAAALFLTRTAQWEDVEGFVNWGVVLLYGGGYAARLSAYLRMPPRSPSTRGCRRKPRKPSASGTSAAVGRWTPEDEQHEREEANRNQPPERPADRVPRGRPPPAPVRWVTAMGGSEGRVAMPAWWGADDLQVVGRIDLYAHYSLTSTLLPAVTGDGKPDAIFKDEASR